MAQKRKTLPKEFDELVNKGDIEGLKKLYDKCELNAYTGYSKYTALGVPNVPVELMEWLVEQGLDVDAEDSYGKTALDNQITYHGSIEQVEKLISLGANLAHSDRFQNMTPLHRAAQSHRADVIELLIKSGADVNAKDFLGHTPLERMLEICAPADIEKTARCADVFISFCKKFKPTETHQKLVKNIGEKFEFYREHFNPDYLEQTENGLEHLYKVFKVPPVPKRVKHDMSEPIKVTSKRWNEQHDELWKMLVPSQGHADTIQGEVIRITGKVSYEILDNGGINWDSEYKKMLGALGGYLSLGSSLDKLSLKKSDKLIKDLYGGEGDEAQTAELCRLAVKWVLKNPQPIGLDKTNYDR